MTLLDWYIRSLVVLVPVVAIGMLLHVGSHTDEDEK